MGEPLSGGGAAPFVGAPDENTCCYPESKYHGWDDHAVTNIRGASISATALHYQMVSFGSDTEEHKPIVVSMVFPNPCSGNSTDPDVCAPARYGNVLCYDKQTDSCCENEAHGTSIVCPAGGTGGCCIGGARASRIQFCCNETTSCCSGEYFETPGSCCSTDETCCQGMGACCATGTSCCYAPISIGADQPPVGTCCGTCPCAALTESATRRPLLGHLLLVRFVRARTKIHHSPSRSSSHKDSSFTVRAVLGSCVCGQNRRRGCNMLCFIGAKRCLPRRKVLRSRHNMQERGPKQTYNLRADRVLELIIVIFKKFWPPWNHHKG